MNEHVDFFKDITVLSKNMNWELFEVRNFMHDGDSAYFLSYKQNRDWLFEINHAFLPSIYLCKISTIEILYKDKSINTPYLERAFDSINNSMSPYDEIIIKNIDKFRVSKSGLINSYPKTNRDTVKISIFEIEKICGFDILSAIKEFEDGALKMRRRTPLLIPI